MLHSGQRYYWSDLIDRNLYVSVDNVSAYSFPGISAPLKFIFDAGDPVPVDSFIVTGGRIWVMIDDYINGGYAYIPLTGALTGDINTVYKDTLNSALLAHGIYTVEHQQANDDDPANPVGSLISAIKGVGSIALIGLTIYGISKIAGK